MNDQAGGSENDRHERAGRLLNEFLDRRAAGRSDSVDDLLAGAPDVADLLREHLALLGKMTSATEDITPLRTAGFLSPLGPQDDAEQYIARVEELLVRRVIGRGGMGIVLEAFQPELERDVAIKVLRPELAGDQRCRMRFSLEARSAARIQHPHVVAIHAVGETGGLPYLVMELVRGTDLAKVLRRGTRLDTATIRRLLIQILAGLGAAHDSGLIHRDVKPSNVLLRGDDWHVKIADFGLARLATDAKTITQPNAILGTLEYMSPEQARGERTLDARSDLYAVGVVLYELLTGASPFRADSATATLTRIAQETPPDPRKVRHDVDPQLARIATRLIAKRPDDRFASAAEAAAALADLRPVPLPARRRQLRWRAIRIVVAGAMLLALAVMAWGPFARSDAPTTRIQSVAVDPQDSRRVWVTPVGLPRRVFLDLPPNRPLPKYGAALVNRGEDEQLIVVGFDRYDTELDARVQAYRPDGELRWECVLTDPYTWPDNDSSITQWHISRVRVGEFDGQPGQDVVVVGSHHSQFPNRITRLDVDTGRPLATFWHTGGLTDVRAVPQVLPDRDAIAACGVNNKLDGFREFGQWDDHYTTCDRAIVAMVLDPLAMDGLGPPASRLTFDRSSASPPLPPRIAPVLAYAFLDYPTFASDARPQDHPDAPDWIIVSYFGDPPPPALELWVLGYWASAEREPLLIGLELAADLSLRRVVPGPRAGPPINDVEWWRARWRRIVPSAARHAMQGP